MPFQFSDYGASDANQCGREFCAELKDMLGRRKSAEIEPAAWTEAVLDWFSRTKARSLVVDASRSNRRPPCGVAIPQPLARFAGAARDTNGPFLVELCHHTYPQYGDEYWTADYWNAAFGSRDRPEIKLALECEWGQRNNPGANVGAIMHHGSKLLHLSARIKTLIYASADESNREQISGLLHKMILHDPQRDAIWLVIDVPWPEWSRDYGPTHQVVTTEPVLRAPARSVARRAQTA